MAISAREKLSIFENVVARVGLNESTLREYHKAISGLRGMQSAMEMQPQMPMQPQEQTPMPVQQGTAPMV